MLLFSSMGMEMMRVLQDLLISWKALIESDLLNLIMIIVTSFSLF